MYRPVLIALVGVMAVVTTGFAATAQTRSGPGSGPGARGPELHGDPRGWTFKLPAGADSARGRAAFEKFECYACHDVKGETFPVPSKRDALGPELSTMGQHHSAAFLVESIMNPGALIDPGQGYAGPDGSSKMPSFADLMTVQELVDLVAYLKSLGPPAPAAAPARQRRHH